MSSPEHLLAALEKAEQGPSGPPVETWDPPLSGDMDMVIRRDGSWWHEGGEIKRHELVKLFASILKKEGGDYFLVTPVEKWRIQVEDLPFIAHTVGQVERDGVVHLLFSTNVDDQVVADEAHPFTCDNDSAGEPCPAILIRRNLYARVGRNAFYALVELAEPGPAGSSGQDGLWLNSAGCRFLLGTVPAGE